MMNFFVDCEVVSRYLSISPIKGNSVDDRDRLGISGIFSVTFSITL